MRDRAAGASDGQVGSAASCGGSSLHRYVVDPDRVSDVGLNVAVTLGPGDPVRVKFTVPTKPFEGTRAIVN